MILRALILVLLISGCSVSRHCAFDWQGHRGNRGEMPENTIASFLKALSYEHISTLEMDVVISSDHQVLLSHEPFFNPDICDTPFADNNIYHLKYADIVKVDCGSKGNPRFDSQEKRPAYKPLFSEVVEAVEDYCAKNDRPLPDYNIEIKSRPEWEGVYHPSIEVYLDLVIEQVMAAELTDRLVLQSFDSRVLKLCKSKYPEIRLALLSESQQTIASDIEQLGFFPDIYSPHFVKLREADVRWLHKREIKVVPWTVNDSSAIRRLIDMGVDGVITDYPNLSSDIRVCD